MMDKKFIEVFDVEKALIKYQEALTCLVCQPDSDNSSWICNLCFYTSSRNSKYERSITGPASIKHAYDCLVYLANQAVENI